MQTTIGLPQEGEDFVFLLQPCRFLLHAFFQHGVAFGEFFGHGIECLAQHRHFIPPADMRALSKIACGYRAGHCQQLFPGVQQPGAQPEDGENQQQPHKQRHGTVNHQHPVDTQFCGLIERGDQRVNARHKARDVPCYGLSIACLFQTRLKLGVPVVLQGFKL